MRPVRRHFLIGTVRPVCGEWVGNTRNLLAYSPKAYSRVSTQVQEQQPRHLEKYLE
jgi:hypothetical protein